MKEKIKAISVPLILFGSFWLMWTILEIIFLNYKGTKIYEKKQGETGKRFSFFAI
jgi:hypothetical protein